MYLEQCDEKGVIWEQTPLGEWRIAKKKYCPFCGANCYTENQVIQHIKAKQSWERRENKAETHYLQTKLINMNNCDYEETKAKFNALIELLGVEIVFEKISDGSGKEEVQCFARKKNKKVK